MLDNTREPLGKIGHLTHRFATPRALMPRLLVTVTPGCNYGDTNLVGL